MENKCPNCQSDIYRDYMELKRYRDKCSACEWQSKIIMDEDMPLNIDKLHEKQKDE